ncbi:hypothetical protein N9064_00495 [bacterium]|nr:hypothetical protein [bacterium]
MSGLTPETELQPTLDAMAVLANQVVELCNEPISNGILGTVDVIAVLKGVEGEYERLLGESK